MAVACSIGRPPLSSGPTSAGSARRSTSSKRTRCWLVSCLESCARVTRRRRSRSGCGLLGGATVCHETIYRAVYSRVFVGLGLRGHDCLRTRRRRRRPRNGPEPARRRRQFGDYRLIDERPAGAADRSEVGHWEGDLIIGAAKSSAVVTLVERSSRLTLLAQLPNRHTARRGPPSRDPCPRRRACATTAHLDVGPRHRDERVEHPRARSRPVRVLLPPALSLGTTQQRAHQPAAALLATQGTNLAVHSQPQLDRIANILNTSPRRLLGWHTPQALYDHYRVALTP